MKSLRVSPSLRELFGEETTPLELGLIVIPALFGALSIFALTRSEWSAVPLWRVILFLLLVVDGMGGFVANLTRSTNAYYRQRLRLRLIFIAVHIHPLLLGLLLGKGWWVCAAVWAYTVLAAFAVNALASRAHPLQRPAAAAFVLAGVCGLLLASSQLPLLLTAALVFYQLKLIFSFAVDHSAR